MPTKPQVKYAPMTSKQAKNAYKKSGPAGPSEWQMKAWTRQNLLLERAQKIKDKQAQAKINKQKRDKKKAKEMQERLKRGLPAVEERYISPRQTKMYLFLPNGEIDGGELDMEDITDGSDSENNNIYTDMEEFTDSESQFPKGLSEDLFPRYLGISKGKEPSLPARVTRLSASQIQCRTSRKHARSSSPAFQDDCRRPKRRFLAIGDSSPETVFDENEWPTTQPNVEHHSASEGFEAPVSAVITDHEAKTASGSLAEIADYQQGHAGGESSSTEAMKQDQNITERTKSLYQIHAGKPALLNHDTKGIPVAESPYMEHKQPVDAADVSEQNLLNEPDVMVKETNNKKQADDEEFGISEEEKAIMAEILQGDPKPEQILSSKPNVIVQKTNALKRTYHEEFGISEEDETFMAQIALGNLDPDEKKSKKGHAVLSGGPQTSLLPAIAQTTNLPPTQHLVYRRPTTVHMHNARVKAQSLTTVEQFHLRRHGSPFCGHFRPKT
ncbi:hypothetical protein MMC15_006632 [Xylographa vitiligo]|nr:hypothetical protein [Xylographa vitiligo]